MRILEGVHGIKALITPRMNAKPFSITESGVESDPMHGMLFKVALLSDVSNENMAMNVKTRDTLVVFINEDGLHWLQKEVARALQVCREQNVEDN